MSNKKMMNVMNNTYVGDMLVGRDVREELKLAVNPLKNPYQNIQTVTQVNLDDSPNVEIYSTKLTYFDRIVANGVYTLWNAGIKTFTASKLFYVITGKKSIKSDQIKKVEESLNKLKWIRVKIDCKDEFNARFGPDVAKRLYFEGPMIPLSLFEGVIADKEVTWYTILSAPPLFQYAKMVHQIILYDPKYLRCGDIKNSEENMIIRCVLLRRIMVLRNQKSHVSSYISFEGKKGLFAQILLDLHKSNNQRMKKQRIISNTKKILDAFKEEKLIYDYKFDIGERKTIEGIELMVFEPKEKSSARKQQKSKVYDISFDTPLTPDDSLWDVTDTVLPF